MEKSKSTRLRFTYEDDIVLLREFLSNNPIFNPQGWDIIQNNMEITMGKRFLIKTLKQHLQLLIEAFLAKVKVSVVRSGIEEPFCENNSLLEEISSLCHEHKYDFKQKKKSTNKDQKVIELGKKAREECAQSYQESVIIEEPADVPTLVLEEHNYTSNGDISGQEIDIKNIENEPPLEVQPPPLSSSTPSTVKCQGQLEKEKEPLKKKCPFIPK